MLKITMNDDMAKIEGEGDLIDTVKDLSVIVFTMYNHIRNANQDAGRIFKKAVTAIMREDSPVWTAVPPKDDLAEIQVIDKTTLLRQMKEERDGRP